MKDWSSQRVARAAGAELLRASPTPAGPAGVAIDSRELAEGELFVGLRGEHQDGGRHAAAALASGAWGVLVTPEHASGALAEILAEGSAGAVLCQENPLAGLQALARAWRAELGAQGAKVIAVTGSSGKTSTKDILAAILSGFSSTTATPANLNTEIGLPLAILAAPAGTSSLVLEMAMRGPRQIAELTAIADPDVGVIVNVGPAHLELLGSIEAIAAAKAELIAGMRAGTTAVVPVDEPLLLAHLRDELPTLTFGPGGDVSLRERRADGTVVIDSQGAELELRPNFGQAHNLINLLAAVAAAGALGYAPGGPLEVEFSAMRGQRSELPGGIVLIEDCYNANPTSMRAAIDDLAETTGAQAGGRASGRTVAVLGDMLELGSEGPALHRALGEHAAARGIGLLVSVGPLARAIAEGFGGESLCLADAAAAARELPALLRQGDTVLLKASRGVGLERVAEALRGGAPENGAGTQKLAGAAGPGRR